MKDKIDNISSAGTGTSSTTNSNNVNTIISSTATNGDNSINNTFNGVNGINNSGTIGSETIIKMEPGSSSSSIIPANNGSKIITSKLPLNINPKTGKVKQTRKKVKKTSRACTHCRKAHMTCDDSRPCKRCVAKGLHDSCFDAPRKKKKYLMEEEMASINSNTEPSDSKNIISGNSPAISLNMSSNTTLSSLNDSQDNNFQQQQQQQLPQAFRLTHPQSSLPLPKGISSPSMTSIKSVNSFFNNSNNNNGIKQDNISLIPNPNTFALANDNSNNSNTPTGSNDEFPSDNNNNNNYQNHINHSNNRNSLNMDNESRSTNSQHNSPYNASNFMSTAADLEYSILGSIIQDNSLLSPDAIMLSPSFSPDENNITSNGNGNGNNNISENKDSIFNKYKPFLGPSNLHTVYNNDDQRVERS
ncbi:unnamed protein product [[Candida] boidinii]|uniref:Transcription activator of gluconeogenesis ERT1 n=1 Tax=Candida boidinii TaxID=5477 RepID=A0A9W6T1W4_CANBO|nr:unnamed protein product [[Candida] boidinii]